MKISDKELKCFVMDDARILRKEFKNEENGILSECFNVDRCRTDLSEIVLFVRENYHNLTQLLISRHLTITTMESATSGQIASLITDTEGSSAVLKGAFVTYCNEAKIRQGVPAEIIDKYTVYSKETAGAMAQACRKAYGANIGIGVTGTMGNVDPANSDASVPGQVYFAIDIDGDVKEYYVELPPQPTRLAYKMAVAEDIYEELIKRLEE